MATCIVAFLLGTSQAAAQTNYTLFIDLTPSGYRGTAQVTSTPAGINCRREPSGAPSAGTCSAQFTSGTTVTLNVTALNDGTFDGWTGACSGTASCQVEMTQNRTVGAKVIAKMYTLSIQGMSAANGPGRVRRGDDIGLPGLMCTVFAGGVLSGDCVSQYPANQTAWIFRDFPSTATTRFLGFSGACTGTEPSCTFVMDGNKTLTVGWASWRCEFPAQGAVGQGRLPGRRLTIQVGRTTVPLRQPAQPGCAW